MVIQQNVVLVKIRVVVRKCSSLFKIQKIAQQRTIVGYINMMQSLHTVIVIVTEGFSADNSCQET